MNTQRRMSTLRRNSFQMVYAVHCMPTPLALAALSCTLPGCIVRDIHNDSSPSTKGSTATQSNSRYFRSASKPSTAWPPSTNRSSRSMAPSNQLTVRWRPSMPNWTPSNPRSHGSTNTLPRSARPSTTSIQPAPSSGSPATTSRKRRIWNRAATAHNPTPPPADQDAGGSR